MGLSNDERYNKVFYTLKGLRKVLKEEWSEYRLKELTYLDAELKKLLLNLDNSARQLTGMVFQWFDSNGGYWLFGENENGFRGYHSDCFWAKDKQDEDIFKRPEDEAQVPDFEQFAKRIGFDKDLVFLAKWWELYSYIPALLYPINRYDDNAFSTEFKSEFNKLLSYIADLKPETNDQSEKVMLLKYKLFYTEATKGIKNLDYEKQDTCLKKYRNMTQQEIEDLQRKQREDKFKWDRKYHAEQEAKREVKTDPVYGILPPELEHKPIAAKTKKRKLRKQYEENTSGY